MAAFAKSWRLREIQEIAGITAEQAANSTTSSLI
jgi:hypothetical protein